jgi:hypothetical protein
MIYWYPMTQGRDYWSFVQHAQAVNLALLDAMSQAGISFTLPPVPPPPGLPTGGAAPGAETAPQPALAAKP